MCVCVLFALCVWVCVCVCVCVTVDYSWLSCIILCYIFSCSLPVTLWLFHHSCVAMSAVVFSSCFLSHVPVMCPVQQLRHEMEQIETWMNLREPLLKEKKYGESIEAVEELLRRHADFEKTVIAQQERVNALSRNEKVGASLVSRQYLLWLIIAPWCVCVGACAGMHVCVCVCVCACMCVCVCVCTDNKGGRTAW